MSGLWVPTALHRRDGYRNTRAIVRLGCKVRNQDDFLRGKRSQRHHRSQLGGYEAYAFRLDVDSTHSLFDSIVCWAKPNHAFFYCQQSRRKNPRDKLSTLHLQLLSTSPAHTLAASNCNLAAALAKAKTAYFQPDYTFPKIIWHVLQHSAPCEPAWPRTIFQGCPSAENFS